MNSTYDPSEIERLAQQYWEEHSTFEVREELTKEKFYCLSMLPYPSGELHMGHVRNYTIGDVISRYQRMLGKNVLQPMGWDAFGLPAENAAIKNALSPYDWTQKNIKRMRKQFIQLGYGIDWSREITTCDPEYYQWEQWLFLKLFQKGLAYKKKSIVNWDPVDETVLANEQVVNGKGWRSGAPVERREISQWFLKITDYADELLQDLDKLTGWPEEVITMQRHWMGRSAGVQMTFWVEKEKEPLVIFTTRPDTLLGVTYCGIAFDHPLAKKAAASHQEIAQFLKQCQHMKVAEADIATREKQGVFSGFYAIHPLTQKKLPIWITNFVLMEYGTGAIMAVPAHDERDHEFALKFHLPIQPVIKPENNEAWDYQTAAMTEEGTLIHSAPYDGLTSKQAVEVIADVLTKNKMGERQTHYRLRDWGISRQRYWGTPIPIIYCKDCGTVPVPETDLPVVLPLDIVPTGHGSPLADNPHFVKTKCPRCGKAAKRETDTMDTFVESSWYYLRYCCPHQDQTMLDDRAKYWTPVDQYVGGIEHAVMHLLYARFMHKLLRDEGLINSNEPFTRLLTQGMVLKDGAKMSKSKGNVVEPTLLIKKYGADTARLFSMFAAPPELSLEWSDTSVEGCFRFLRKVWQFALSAQPVIKKLNQHFSDSIPLKIEDCHLQNVRKQIHSALQQANFDYARHQFNTVVSACMIIQNLISKLNVHHAEQATIIREGLSILLRLLAPITPHITHVLWRELDFENDILEAGWPKANQKAMQTTTLELVVQINGKLRGHISVAADTDKKEIEEAALRQENIKRFLEDKSIKKIIIVPGKLINIVI
ncbi:MAG: leucine--tRNA ligase [Coxiella sp. RIFCSPHIGHO2_12_FULL_42_15]|nr:MAG: leucine--tRNA ligase [Coxiella sp. RIFCSPHIGHO2_12_FULL_42_15]